jgi:hypothetical protein
MESLHGNMTISIGETMQRCHISLDPNKVQLKVERGSDNRLLTPARGVRLALPFARRHVAHLQLPSHSRRTKRSSSR